MPNGRQSRRSNRTGPAATGAAVASRIAVTASASSPGASGVSSYRRQRARARARRSGRLAAESRGSRPAASGHIAESSPVAATRTRIPSPSSIWVPTESADQRRDGAVGVAVAVERRLELGVRLLEGVVVPVEAAAALGGAHEQRHEHRRGLPS